MVLEVRGRVTGFQVWRVKAKLMNSRLVCDRMAQGPVSVTAETSPAHNFLFPPSISTLLLDYYTDYFTRLSYTHWKKLKGKFA